MRMLSRKSDIRETFSGTFRSREGGGLLLRAVIVDS